MQRDLVVRAMGGDHDAFTELVRIGLARLYAVARLILRDSEMAEDAVQEALVACWRDLSALRDPDRFEAWLRSLLVRACYREARRARGHRSLTAFVRPVEGIAPDPALDLADRDQVERAMAGLSPEQRALLVLHFYLGLALPETAEALGLPVGTVKSRLYRTTTQMRATLEAEARLPLIGRQAT